MAVIEFIRRHAPRLLANVFLLFALVRFVFIFHGIEYHVKRETIVSAILVTTLLAFLCIRYIWSVALIFHAVFFTCLNIAIYQLQIEDFPKGFQTLYYEQFTSFFSGLNKTNTLNTVLTINYSRLLQF